MNKLSAQQMLRMLRAVQNVEALTNAMRISVRPPPPKILYGAVAGIEIIHETLLGACVSDVAIDPAALAERVAEATP